MWQTFHRNMEATMGFFDSVVTVVSSAAHGDLGKAGHDLAAAASTIGMPLGEFYASFARHYGDAAMGTLEHLNKAIDDAVGHDSSKVLDAGADAIKNALEDIGSAAGKVIEAVEAHEQAPQPDGHSETETPSAVETHDESLMEKAQNAVDEVVHQAIDKASDILEKATHDPISLLNQAAEAIKDHLGNAADALAKLNDASHATGEHAAACASDEAETGTTDAALTETPATEGTAASAVADAHVTEPEAQEAHSEPSFGRVVLGNDNSAFPQIVLGNHASETKEIVLGNHAAESAMPQPLPPGGTEASTFEGHDVQTLQSALNGISFSALALDGAQAGQADGAEAGKIVIGGQEMALDSLMDGAQQAPVCDHDMLPHVEMPSLLELHAAHLAHQLV
jgi:hypothetical protein